MYSDIGIYSSMMARAATTTDVFNAIAEPRRRQIVELLAGGQKHSVNHLVLELGLQQPAVSKHLGVLRKVGLVSVTRQKQQRLYSLNAGELKPVNDWVCQFERYWTNQVDRIKQRAEEKAAEAKSSRQSNPPSTGTQTRKERSRNENDRD